MRIEWVDRALDDLDEALAYIAEHNPQAARQTAQAVRHQLSHLIRHPNMGRQGRVKSTRELVIPQTHFVIPYRLTEATLLIEILAVMHDAREWPGDL